MPPSAHLASADAMVGESSAVPFEAAYCEEMMHVCLASYGGGCPYEAVASTDEAKRPK